MKKIFAVILIATVLPALAADDRDARKNAILEQFKSDEEPTAIDAVWMSESSFYVGVRDDGSNRDGYADYVCQALYEHGFKGEGIVVRVIDVAKAGKGDVKTLGKKLCD